MNVLIFSQHFWPESFRINEVAEDLISEVDNLYILTGKPNYPAGKIFPGYSFWGCQQESMKGIEVYRVPLLPRGNATALEMFCNYISFMFFAFFCGPFLLRKKKIDIVFVYGTSPLIQGLAAILFKLFFRSKLVVWVQDLWPEDLASTGHIKNPVLLKLNEWPAKLLYFWADRILIQSEAFKPIIKKLAKKKELYYLPNPAEREVFFGINSYDLPSKLDFMKSNYVVTFTGNVGNNQSIQTIINAADLMRDCKDIIIVIVGSGSKSEFLANEIERLKLHNLKAVGRYPLKSMPAIFKYSDALLVTLANKNNLNWTIPSKIQAYMASSKPIIASLNGEGARIIREANCGLTCQAEDSAQLYKCILDIYNMSISKREAIGSNGRQYAEKNYHPQLIIHKLISHLNAVIDRS